MAALQPKLEIKITIDPTGAVKGASVVSKNLGGLTKSTGTANSAANKLSKTLGTMWRITGGILLFNVIRKITRALEGLVKVGEDFDTSMHNVLSVTQDDKGFQKLTDDVINLALDPRIKDGPALLADGLYFIVSAGYDAADAMVILKQAAYGATAGLSTTATASEVLIGTMGAFGFKAKDAEYVMNELFGIVAASKYTFNDLATAMDTVSPTAAKLGLNLDEVGAAIATFGFQGVDANTATVELNGILTGLLKPTQAMTDQLHAFGYESGEAMLNALGFTKTMEMFQGVIGDSAQKASDLFGDVRALRGIMFLTAQQGDIYNQMLAKMGDSQKDGGATLRALNEQMKAASFQIAVFKKDIQILATLGFGLLAPYLVRALSGINTFVANGLQYFRHFREKGYGFFHALRAAIKDEVRAMFGTETLHSILKWTDKFIGYFYDIREFIKTLIPPIKKVFGFLVDHLTTIIPLIIGAVVGIKLFTAGMAILEAVMAVLAFEFTPITIAIIAIAALGALFALAWTKNWFDIRDVTKVVILGIIVAFQWIWKALEPVRKVLGDFAHYIHRVFHGADPKDLAKFPKFLQPLIYIFGRLTKTVRIFLKTWEDHGFIAAIKTILVQIRALGRAFANLLESMGLHNTAVRVKEMFYLIAKTFKDVVQLVDDLVHGRWRKVFGDLKNIALDLVYLFIDRLLLIPDIIWDIFNAIPWGKVGHALHRMGAWSLGMLWKGIKSVAGWVWQHLKDWFQSRVDKEMADARQWYDVGRNFLSWLWTGIASLLSWIGGQVSNIPGALIQALEWSGWMFFNFGRDIVSSIWNGIVSLWDWLKGQISTLPGQIWGWLSDVPKHSPMDHAAAEIGKMAMMGIGKGIKDNKSSVLAAASDARDSIFGALGGNMNIRVGGSTRGGTPAAVPHVAGGARSRGPIQFGERSVIVELKEGSRIEANRAARYIWQEVRRLEAAG